MQATVTFPDDFVSADLLPDWDADTARCVENRLANSAYMPLRALVRCQCRDGVVTLTGILPSFYLKQLAQRIAMSVCGGKQVVNDICVDGLPAM